MSPYVMEIRMRSPPLSPNGPLGLITDFIFHPFCFIIFQVASEHFYFWLTALKCFCEAESLLSVPCDSQLMLAKQISEACAKYHKGITTLKVCVNVNEPKIKLNNLRWSFCHSKPDDRSSFSPGFCVFQQPTVIPMFICQFEGRNVPGS